MSESPKSTPPRTTTIIDRIKNCYLLWIKIIPHMVKLHRATIGARIGNMFLEIIELAYHAYYATTQEKLPLIIATLKKVDTLKLLLAIAWEGKLIQTGHFSELTDELQEVSKMLGGWKRGIESKQKSE